MDPHITHPLDDMYSSGDHRRVEGLGFIEFISNAFRVLGSDCASTDTRLNFCQVCVPIAAITCGGWCCATSQLAVELKYNSLAHDADTLACWDDAVDGDADDAPLYTIDTPEPDQDPYS